MNGERIMEALKQISLMCDEIEYEVFICGSYVSDGLKNKSVRLLRFSKTAPLDIKKLIEKRLHDITEKSCLYTKIWLYSVMISLTYDPVWMEEFLQYIILEKQFTPNNRYYLYYQAKFAIFSHIQMESTNTKLLKWKLLEQLVEEFRKELKDVLVKIPFDQRNKDVVFVITEQILKEMHAPTMISFDRCKILIEHMHKNVLLINTAEVLPHIGAIPYYDEHLGNYCNELSKKEFVEWKGTSIPYFQCDNNMPDINVLRMLLQKVRDVKPGLVVSVGGSSILSNLINDMIPVLTVGLSPSDLEMTITKCQTLSRQLAEEDLFLLEQMGLGKESIIQGVFTSSMKPKTVTVTRKELGLPEDKFILTVVGYRLETDIDDRFMNMLVKALDEEMAVAVIGKFPSYKDYLQKNPKLDGKVYCLGMTSDILAWLQVCDLYVNPYRKGGGTSGVEALYQGIPVITLPYGDVSVNVGEEFWTESYETMVELIQRYKNDTDFYHTMVELAKERVERLLDTTGEFQRIIDEFKKRIRD